MPKPTRISVAAVTICLLALPCIAASQKQDGAASILEKAVKAMGGPDAVDSVHSLELHGTSKRRLPNDEEWEIPTVSYIGFPDRYRQEATIPVGGTLITIVTPAGAFLQTGQTGAVQMPDAQKSEILKTIARNPVALLQRRKSLESKLEGETQVDGKPAVILHLDEKIGSTTLVIDKKSGQIRQLKYTTAGGAQSLPAEMTIRYSDYSPAGKLVYPHASSGEVAGKQAFTYHLDSMVINGPLDSSLFMAMTEPPAPAQPGAQSGSSNVPGPAPAAMPPHTMQHPAPTPEPPQSETTPKKPPSH